jgi:hypothetical protein
MMTTILFVYVFLIAPVFKLALWAFKRRAAKKAEEVRPAKAALTELERVVTEAFGKQGIPVEVHEMPKNPTEAIVMASQQILSAIKESGHASLSWLTSLRDKADANKRDMDAMLQVAQSIAKMLLDMKDAPAKEPGSIKTFVNNLEYARDTFAKTPAQKKVVEAIIINVKTAYEPRK